MKSGFTILFFLLIFRIEAFAQYAENSELASGNIYKIAVAEDGIYKIDATTLQSLGVDISSTEPDNIRILGYGGGMLPQANSANRYDDLIENPVKVKGGGDGSFNSEDHIIFFGRGPHKLSYDTLTEEYEYQLNLYADTNYYFLKIDSKPSLKIQSFTETNTATGTINYFDEIIHHEIDEFNLLNTSAALGGSGSGSGRRWFGERFDFLLNYDFNYEVEGIKEGSTIKLKPVLMSTSRTGGAFNINYNQTNIANISIPAIAESTYALKGRTSENTYTFTANDLSNLEISFEFEKKSSSSKDAGYLDYFTIQYLRKNAIYNEQTIFRSSESLKNAYSKFVFSNQSNEIEVWNVTDQGEVFQVQIDNEGNSKSFIANTESLQEFVVFSGTSFNNPITIGKVTNQNLHNFSQANLIIVTTENFKQAAIRLADFRQINDQLYSHVVTVDQIYNEFSSGRQDITAIRDFIRMIYKKSSASDSLRYVLLFGDGSFDFKNRTEETKNGNLIPIYQAYESLHPISSYSSDDYFGFMDENEGEWSEDSNTESHDLDLGVGRLPINNLEEAKVIVDKLIRYSSAKEALGDWRKKVVLVADDGDSNTHQNQADDLGSFVEQNYSNFNVNRVFVDAYPQIISPTTGTNLAPVVREVIDKNIDNGVLIMNYSGHGAESGWADEKIVTDGQIVNWDNKYRMPLFVTATCEFGRYDNPNLKSGAEHAILNPNGGAIALITTTRPVYSNKNFLLNQAFYKTVFQTIKGEFPRLGDIQRVTKNESNTGVSNRNFALLGDPSMKLAYPENDIVITSVKNGLDEVVDTIRALDYIQLEGEVRSDNNLISSFNGNADLTIYDKPTTITTYGDEGANTVMEFEDRRTVIYRGSVSVSKGKFKTDFVVPKDISYTFDFGKISIYAKDTTIFKDASGDLSDLIIGGTSSYETDNSPPDVTLYIEDEGFESGGIVPANTMLYANIFDENGINITGNGIGHEITAILDDETVYNLNDYFTNDLDNFQQGSIAFPLKELEVGEHQLTFKVWDNFNNSTEKRISFKIIETDGEVVYGLTSYPNPFTNSTTISYFNTLSGEEVEVDVGVFDATGKLINEFHNSIFNTNLNVNIVEWNGYSFDRKKVKGGLYIFKVYLYYPKSGYSYNGIIKVFFKS